MSFARELNFIPVSDGTLEIHFGNVIGDYFMWVEFQKKDGTIWRGSFSCGDTKIRAVIEQSNEKYIIVADGIGYIINNETSSLHSKIPIDQILCCEKIDKKKCFVADSEGFYILLFDSSLQKIQEFKNIAWIEIISNNSKSIIGKFDAIEFQWKTKQFIVNKTTQQLILTES